MLIENSLNWLYYSDMSLSAIIALLLCGYQLITTESNTHNKRGTAHPAL